MMKKIENFAVEIYLFAAPETPCADIRGLQPIKFRGFIGDFSRVAGPLAVVGAFWPKQ
jgi:hypothetical protein